MRTTNPRALAAVALAMLTAGLTPALARAGTYTAIQCAPSHGAGAGSFDFRRTSRDFRSARRCGDGGSGLEIRHAHRRSKPRRFGAWTTTAPPGTAFLGGSVAARGHGHNAYKTNLSYVTAANQSVSFAHPSRRRFKRYEWSPSAPVHGLAAALVCSKHGASCGPTTSRGCSSRRRASGSPTRFAHGSPASAGRSFTPTPSAAPRSWGSARATSVPASSACW